MRPPVFPLCGFVALSLVLVSPISAAPPRTSATPKSSKKDAGAEPHVVKKGETLWSISQKYNTSVGELMEVNKMAKDAVWEGLKLKIPPKMVMVVKPEGEESAPAAAPRKEHTIGPGETYWSIAKNYKTTTEELEKANPGISPTRLRTGMKINLPGNPPAAPAGDRKKTADAKPAVTLKGPEYSGPPVKAGAGAPKPGATPSVTTAAPAPSPSPTPAPAPTSVPEPVVPAGEGIVHTIAEGDTFYALGRKYGVTMESIVTANPEVDPRRMKNGIKVRIPAKPDGTKPVVPVASAKPAAVSPSATPAPPLPAAAVTTAAVSAAARPPAAKPQPVTLAPPMVLASAPLPPSDAPPPNSIPIPKPKPKALVDSSGAGGEPDRGAAPPPGTPAIVAAPKVSSPPPAAPSGTAAAAPVMAQKTSSEAAAPTLVDAPAAPEPSPSPADDPPPASKPPANTVGADGVIRSYIVSEGETEATICEAFGISKEQLYEYNRLPATARLKAGDEIMIPRVAKIR